MNASPSAVPFLAEVQQHLRRTKRTQNRLIFLSFSLAFFLVLFLLDVVYPIASWLRSSLLLLGIIAGTVLIRRLRKNSKTPDIPAETLARTIERRFPQADNALIHAVQFSDSTLALSSYSSGFIAREHQRANDEAARIPLHKSVPLPAYQRTRILFALLVIAWACLIVWYPRVHGFEIPRYFALWKETPPYSPTNFMLDPEKAEVKSGANVKITVRVSGVLPRSLTLITQTQNNAPQTVAMTDKGNQTYTVTLENLTADTTFYAQGDTGRSQTGTIRIVIPDNKTKSQTASRASEMFRKQNAQPKRLSEQAAKASGTTGTGYGNKQKPLPPKTYSLGQGQSQTVKTSRKPIIIKEAGDISRFPSNYRRLLQDYFRSGR